MFGGASQFRSAQSRSRVGNSQIQGINYPSPFFDVAHTWLPVTIKQMFRWCRYYFLTNSLIHATAFKLSEYPVTDIVVEHENPEVVKKWTEFLQDQLLYRSFQIEAGLDYHVYGNSIISVNCPFQKMLQCAHCGFEEKASHIKNSWRFVSLEFRLTCPRCGQQAPAKVRDVHIRNASGIRLMRWNPENIEIGYNDVTGEYTYFYDMPVHIKRDIEIGRKDTVDKMPQIFIQAMKEQKSILFSPDALFHLKRPSLATQDRGWGTPILLPVLKDTFYLQIMKKAQEAILLEHIVPLRVLFPQPGSGSADPYTSINLADWRDHVAREIAHWRYDQNYIPIMPLPVGNQTIGGDGKALLLAGEIQQWSEQIMVGMGVPREFLIGGMSYAGTNVSMRMLENAFIRYIQRHEQLLRFVIREVAAYMRWPVVNVRFKPFKMADDIQRKAFLLQLNQNNKISDKTLLADSDLSVEEENAHMLHEADGRLEATKKSQIAMANLQGEVQTVMAKYQAKAQAAQMAAMQTGPAQGEPGGADGSTGIEQSPLGNGQNPQIDLPTYAMMQAQQLSMLPEQQQQAALQNLRAQSPELADLVLQYLSQFPKPQAPAAGGTANQQAATQVNMTPLPEQRAPRRAATTV